MPTVTDAKTYLRVAHDDDDQLIQTLLDASRAELAGYIGAELPEPLPADLHMAILEQTARAYDHRGEQDAKPGLTPAAARIAARYKPVSAGTAL